MIKKLKQVEQEFRGKKYMSLWLGDKELPFTTELGKNWSLWQAYREFKGNCDDEGGKIWVSTTIPMREDNKTRIIVSGNHFLKIHEDKHKYFWDEANAMMLDDSNSRSLSNAGSLFYRGIKVGETFKETDYSYNIVDKELELSEDRTITSWGEHQFTSKLTTSILSSSNEELIEEFVCSKDSRQFENLSFALFDSSSVFDKVVKKIYATQPERLQGNLVEQISKDMGGGSSYPSLPLTPLDIKERDRALALIKPLGLNLR